MLRRYALRYMVLDNVFHAVELGVRDRIILVNNTYITPGALPCIMPGESESTQIINKMLYGERSLQVINELIAPMIDMNFSVGELMALRLLIFWNPSGLTVSPQTKTILQMASDRAVSELHRWYADQKYEAADTRLGNVLLLLSPFSDQVHYLSEVVKLIPSFGVLNERDCCLQNILTS
ncbi:unnamed protein product [Gongylonema pulchrum]|uniref:NR LBD domain-containing protein n=2 Tax=Gongylonema pulchrum TaxID=637853 RepID=A0A3P7MAY2_9BILA|nr:unnamed protein product [Gongylonema pulchrum]